MRKMGIKNLRFKLCVWMLLGTLAAQGMSARADARVQPVDDTVVIVIDPGHGGTQLGTTPKGFEEKSAALITAKAMYDELSKYDNVKVYLTRTEDVKLTLKERAEYAKSVEADFLFSIHYNASETHDFFGSEVWVSCLQPYHAYGYQFGCVQMQTMREKGLFWRGVKTRVGDRGDYYGIIRESVALEFPAVIIEHCYADEARDAAFCNTKEKQEELGRADALSVAKYFGLKSKALKADYSSYSSKELVAVQSSGRMEPTILDGSAPNLCQITLTDVDKKTGEATFEVSGEDDDGMLLYYDYSIDGGKSYSPKEPWPGCNTFDDTYQKTFTVTLKVPADKAPQVTFRAFNKADTSLQSNVVDVAQTTPKNANAGNKNNANTGAGSAGNDKNLGNSASVSAGNDKNAGNTANDDKQTAGNGKNAGNTASAGGTESGAPALEVSSNVASAQGQGAAGSVSGGGQSIQTGSFENYGDVPASAQERDKNRGNGMQYALPAAVPLLLAAILIAVRRRKKKQDQTV